MKLHVVIVYIFSNLLKVVSIGADNEHPHNLCEHWLSCHDIDECQFGQLTCDTENSNRRCYNNAPFYFCCRRNAYEESWGLRFSYHSCDCPYGYIVSVNPDGYDAHSEPPHFANQAGLCIPLLCQDGYEFNEDGNQCVDANECSNETHSCAENEVCSNTEGSYVCDACQIGYTFENGSCVNVNECEDTELNAAEVCAYSTDGRNREEYRVGVCIDTDGSYSCACPPGTEVDNIRCSTSGLNGTYDYMGVQYPHVTCTYHPTCVNTNECLNDPCPNQKTCNDIGPTWYYNYEFFRCCGGQDIVEDLGTGYGSTWFSTMEVCQCPQFYSFTRINGEHNRDGEMIHYRDQRSCCDARYGCAPIICDVGFDFSETGYYCEDVDECLSGSHNCQQD